MEVNNADSGPKSSLRSIAFVSGKGGTGKSTIAACVAYVLAHCGFRTALLDLDLFTNGLTFYVLRELAWKPRRGLGEVFMGQCDVRSIEPVLIPDAFTKERLWVLPSHMQNRRIISELRIPELLLSINGLRNTIHECLEYCDKVLGCEFVIIDTRGGTDHTSAAAALAADGYVMITEADKPSWDMGRLLIDTFDDCETREGVPSDRLGFVINKNVLPPEAIEAFLRRAWMCPHLCTIPLDETAVRCFQEDKVPVAEDIGCEFSRGVLRLTRRLCLNADWPQTAVDVMKSLESDAMKTMARGEESARREKRLERMNLLIRAYAAAGSMMAMVALMWMVFREKDMSGTTSSMAMLMAGLATGFVFLMSFGDPSFIRSMARLFSLGQSSGPRGRILNTNNGIKSDKGNPD